jgi:hypothetical protein
MATPAPKTDTPGTQAISLPPAHVAAVPPNATEPQVSKQKQNRHGPRRRRYGGGGPPAVGRREGQFRAAHLVVGPLPNSAAAASLRARFSAARTACRAAKFDGEQIAQQ